MADFFAKGKNPISAYGGEMPNYGVIVSDGVSDEIKIGIMGEYTVYRRYINKSASLPYQAWGTVLTATQLSDFGIDTDKVMGTYFEMYYNGNLTPASSAVQYSIDAVNGLRCAQHSVGSTITAYTKGFIEYYR